MRLPENVKLIINKLYDNGYKAYAVGGCIRDSLMGKKPNDWDICTDSLPYSTKNIFHEYKSFDTGITHGTITVLIEDVPYEITTFRIDGKYNDNRHPETVKFVLELNEDLKRRDFTVNAIAYNHIEGLIDIFSSQLDIKNKIIRCIGNPDSRFNEDALRIMRAIRFSATLNFTIDPLTKESIFKNTTLLKNIAQERLTSEFTKLLLSNNCNALYDYRKVLDMFIPNAENIDCELCTALAIAEMDKCARLALFCLKLYNNLTDEQIKNILTNLKFDSKTIKNVISIILICKKETYYELSILRSMLTYFDYDIIKSALKTKKALFTVRKENTDKLKKAEETLIYIIENNLCCKISELQINGNDLKMIGIENGSIIGKILNSLLLLVISDEIKNEKNLLIKKASELLKTLEDEN